MQKCKNEKKQKMQKQKLIRKLKIKLPQFHINGKWEVRIGKNPMQK